MRKSGSKALIGLVFLSACWRPPTETGERGVFGKIIDNNARPVADFKVESVEEEARTDEQGKFMLQYKPPEQFVFFKRGAVTHRWVYSDEDKGKVVKLHLPPERPWTLHCPEEECALEVKWELGERYFAEFRKRCKPGKNLAIDPAPSSTPTVVCKAGAGKAATNLAEKVRIESRHIWLREGSTRFEIKVNRPALVGRCSVFAGSRRAAPRGKNYVAEVERPSLVHAECVDLPTMPVLVTPDALPELLEFNWTKEIPVLTLPKDAAWGTVMNLKIGEHWATLHTKVRSSWLLPPLPPGSYSFDIIGHAAGTTNMELPYPEVKGEGAVLTYIGARHLRGTIRITEPDLIRRELKVTVTNEPLQRPETHTENPPEKPENPGTGF